EFAHFVRSPEGKWRQFAGFKDRLVQATWGADGDLYIVSRVEAPRGKIVRIDFATLDARKPTIVVPEGQISIVPAVGVKPTVLPMKSRLYVLYQQGGPSTVKAFDLAGSPVQGPRELAVARAEELTPLDGDDLIYAMGSFTEPTTQYHSDARAQ